MIIKGSSESLTSKVGGALFRGNPQHRGGQCADGLRNRGIQISQILALMTLHVLVREWMSAAV